MPHDKKMTILLMGSALLVFAIVIAVCWFVFFAQPNPPLPQAPVTVMPASSTVAFASSTSSSTADVSSSSSAPVGADQLRVDGITFDVEIASTTVQKARGLSYRPSLAPNAGMLFIFGSGSVQTFWMKDMNFPLDMIWISGNTIVGFAQNAPAEPNVILPTSTYSSPNKTDKVLEVNAGTVKKYNIKVGDTVTIGPIK